MDLETLIGVLISIGLGIIALILSAWAICETKKTRDASRITRQLHDLYETILGQRLYLENNGQMKSDVREEVRRNRNLAGKDLKPVLDRYLALSDERYARDLDLVDMPSYGPADEQAEREKEVTRKAEKKTQWLTRIAQAGNELLEVTQRERDELKKRLDEIWKS